MTEIIEGLRSWAGLIIQVKEDRKIKYLKPRKDLLFISNELEWGYGGSGPAQLALAIIARYSDDFWAKNLYMAFKWDIVSKLPREHFVLKEEDIRTWIATHKKEMESYYASMQ